MHEVREQLKEIKGTPIVTYERDIWDANVIEAEAGTTGFMGGDAGHGGKTYFRIQDGGGTAINAVPLKGRNGESEGFEVLLSGDAELRTVITALKFIVSVLEDESREEDD